MDSEVIEKIIMKEINKRIGNIKKLNNLAEIRKELSKKIIIKTDKFIAKEAKTINTVKPKFDIALCVSGLNFEVKFKKDITCLIL